MSTCLGLGCFEFWWCWLGAIVYCVASCGCGRIAYYSFAADGWTW